MLDGDMNTLFEQFIHCNSNNPVRQRKFCNFKDKGLDTSPSFVVIWK